MKIDIVWRNDKYGYGVIIDDPRFDDEDYLFTANWDHQLTLGEATIIAGLARLALRQ